MVLRQVVRMQDQKYNLATGKIFVVKTMGQGDGRATDREKRQLGPAYNQEAPDGHYIVIDLQGYKVVSDEYLKELRDYKKKYEKETRGN